MSDDLVKRLRERVALTNKPFATTPAMCGEAADAIERKDAALRVALEALEECSDDLKAEIDYRHGLPPRMEDRYQRDFAPVNNAWKAIAKIKEALDGQ